MACGTTVVYVQAFVGLEERDRAICMEILRAGTPIERIPAVCQEVIDLPAAGGSIALDGQTITVEATTRERLIDSLTTLEYRGTDEQLVAIWNTRFGVGDGREGR
jgi:hypothetical protein